MTDITSQQIDDLHRVLIRNRVESTGDPRGVGHDLATPLLATNHHVRINTALAQWVFAAIAVIIGGRLLRAVRKFLARQR